MRAGGCFDAEAPWLERFFSKGEIMSEIKTPVENRPPAKVIQLRPLQRPKIDQEVYNILNQCKPVYKRRGETPQPHGPDREIDELCRMVRVVLEDDGPDCVALAKTIIACHQAMMYRN